MYKLSPSSLSLMKDCPRCFWLEKHKVWKRPVSVFPSLPSGMDRILKEHFDRFRVKGELPPELKGKVSGKLFNDVELLKKWRNNLKGVSYTDEKGNVLHGAVDEILIDDRKRLIVLDFKTRGYALKEDTHEHYREQINVYNFLLLKNGFKSLDYAYLLFYYPKEVLTNSEFVFFNELVKIKNYLLFKLVNRLLRFLFNMILIR